MHESCPKYFHMGTARMTDDQKNWKQTENN